MNGREDLLARLRELERTNRALTRELQDLRALVDTPLNVMLFSLDINYNYIAFNQAHREFVKHNWNLDIHPGMHVFDILDPDEREASRRNFDRVLGGESYILRRRYRRPKGEIGFYQNTYVPLVRGGEILGAVVFAHDITEWSEREEEGRKYRAIFEKALEGIYRSTAQGRFLEANREMARILGYDSPEDLMASVINIGSQLYCDPDDRERVFSVIRNEGVIKDFETRMRRKDGSEIWVEFNARSEKDDQGRTAFIEGKLTDITARKDAERKAELRSQKMIQADKMASLGVLVAGVAHEINTPVGVALSATSTMAEKNRILTDLFGRGEMKRSDLSEYLESTREGLEMGLINLNRASDLIRSFKLVAADQISESRRSFNVREYVGQVLLSLRPKLKKTSHRVEVVCDEDLVIESFPGAFSQILTNFIVNTLTHAYDEGQSGQIRIEISRGDGILNMTYSDDGRGMPPEVQDKIFEPFFTTARAKGSTGLGLHIVFNTVTRTLGGTVTCCSAPGHGTTFQVRVPVGQGEA